MHDTRRPAMQSSVFTHPMTVCYPRDSNRRRIPLPYLETWWASGSLEIPKSVGISSKRC